jgi:hypothetical protein
MAKINSLPLVQNLNNANATFVNADSTTLKTVFTAGANDTHLKGILVSSTDTSAVKLQFWLRTGGVDSLIGTVNIPALSGTDGATNAIDALNSVAMPGLPGDAVGKRYIGMKNGDTLKIGPVAAVTSGKTLYVTFLGEDF